MYSCLADMWVNDVRLKNNIDKMHPRLTEYQRDAVKAWVASK